MGNSKIISNSVVVGILCIGISACGGGGGSSAGGTTTPPVTPVPTVNNPPVVDAGSDLSVNEKAQVLLQGSASDSDGTVQAWHWSQTAGTDVILADADTATPSFSAPTVLVQAGVQTLIFQAQVTDNEGSTATDTLSVMVNPVNVAPVANAGVDQVGDEGAVIQLSATASDVDGFIESVQWTQTAGESVTLSAANSLTPSFIATNSEFTNNYQFELSITDNEGETVSDAVNVEVRPLIVGLVVDDRLAGASVQLLDINDNSLIASAETDANGRYQIAGKSSLPSRYWLSITGGTLNGQPFVGTLSSVCLRAERLVCHATPLTTLVKRYAEHKNELQNGDKSQWLATLSDRLGFDFSSEPFVNENQTEVPLDTIRVFLQNGEQLDTWLNTTLDYVENNVADERIAQWFPKINALPVVDAGSDQTVDEQSTVTLSASAADSDGSIVSYLWSQTFGSSVTLTNAESATASFTSPVLVAAETLSFMVTVTDNEGAIATDMVSVTVNPVNLNPIVDAGNDQSVIEQTTVTLNATASDGDGAIVSYLWSQTLGSSVTLTNAESATASFTSPVLVAAETLSFMVTVTDNEGAIATDMVSVTVNPVNLNPIVDAGNDQSVIEQTTVTLNATASDGDGAIVSYLWSQTAGNSVTLNNANTASASFTAPTVTELQTLTFAVTVTDNEGASVSDTVSVLVNFDNALPIASAGADQNVDEQSSVNLIGSGSDSDGTIESYSWLQTAGTTVSINNANSANANFTAPTLTSSETLTFQLSVTDNEGAKATDSVNVQVNPVNVAPIASAGDDQTVNAGETVSLSGSQSSDGDGDVLSFTWRLDSVPNGSVASLSSSSSVETTFVADIKGTYVTSLQVNDGTESSAVDTVTITANPVNSAATGSINISGTTEVGEILTATNTLADANGLGNFSYQWRRTKAGVTSNISTASSTTYTIETTDVGYTLSMNISYTDGDGFAESVNSAETTEVTEAASAGKPNILLIIADDQGLDASAQYSVSTDLPSTPNIDALASSGLVFENAWATPACTTTRGTLITGQHGVNSGITTVPDIMDSSTNTLQRYIKSLSGSSDYQTAVIGKWHIGGANPDLSHPTDSGVDYYAGTIAGTIDDYYNWDLVQDGQSSTSTVYHTTKITDLAIDWLNVQNTANTPWFLWLAFVAPHKPFHLPPASLHNRTDLTGEADHIAAHQRDYYLAALEAMDSEIGRLLDSMPQKERENTLIVYIGDNGTPSAVIDGAVFDSGHSKGTLFEGGIRIPMVASGYGVTRQNQRETALVNTSDFYATFSQLVGGSLTEINDSYSFLNLLTETGSGMRSYNYSEFESTAVTGWAVRNNDYKLIELTGGSQSLYKVSDDLGETNDLIADASLSATITALDNQASRVRGETSTTPVDITNATLTNRSANCADYIESYQSSVLDVNRSLAFTGDLAIKVENGKCIFNTDNIPNHNFNDGSQSFPNNVSEQSLELQITASPSHATSVTYITLTTDNAILLNGVKVDLLAAACYGVGDGKVGCNDINQPWRYDPMFVANGFRVDTHNAHSQPDGSYHYHGQPNALFDANSTVSASPVIGFAADGYPIYGTYINDNSTVRKALSSYQLKSGSRPSGTDDPGGTYDGTFRDDYEYVVGSGDLDECNGMTVDGVYGYYVTDGFPYILACYKGTPDSSFNKQ